MNWQDLTISIGLSIVTGIISGVYTGLVMAKFTSFCQTRLMIVTICRDFSASGTNGVLDGAAFPREEEIAQHACTLLYLGHESAGGNALQLSKEIGQLKYAVEAYFHCKIMVLPFMIVVLAGLSSLMTFLDSIVRKVAQ